jgi:hypothetical protein
MSQVGLAELSLRLGTLCYCAKGMLEGDDFKEWFYIIPSKRRPSEYWAKKISSVVDDSGRTWGGPLVVFDTASSNMDIEDNSSNSKVGQFIAALKEASRSELLTISVWIVLHVAKSLREGVAEDLNRLSIILSAWALSSWTGDKREQPRPDLRRQFRPT